MDYIPGKNILNKVKKLRKKWQEQKTLISFFTLFLAKMQNFYFWKGNYAKGYVLDQCWGLLVFSSFSTLSATFT